MIKSNLHIYSSAHEVKQTNCKDKFFSTCSFFHCVLLCFCMTNMIADGDGNNSAMIGFRIAGSHKDESVNGTRVEALQGITDNDGKQAPVSLSCGESLGTDTETRCKLREERWNDVY